MLLLVDCRKKHAMGLPWEDGTQSCHTAQPHFQSMYAHPLLDVCCCRLTDSLLEFAKKRIDSFAHVGITEDADSSTEVAASLFSLQLDKPAFIPGEKYVKGLKKIKTLSWKGGMKMNDMKSTPIELEGETHTATTIEELRAMLADKEKEAQELYDMGYKMYMVSACMASCEPHRDHSDSVVVVLSVCQRCTHMAEACVRLRAPITHLPPRPSPPEACLGDNPRASLTLLLATAHCHLSLISRKQTHMQTHRTATSTTT